MCSAAATATHSPEMPADAPRMKGPVTASLMFHVTVVILCIFGLPYIHHDVPLPEEPLSVELAKPDELNQTTKPVHARQAQPPQQLEKPPPVPPMPQAPLVTEKTPPTPTEPEKPPQTVDKTPSVAVPDQVALPKKPPKPAHPPKPPAKKPPPKDKPADQQQAFNSVLKNLIAPKNQGERDDTPDKADKSTPDAKVSQEMSSTEFAALQKQLGECWSIISGARMAEDLVVDVKLTMNPDRSVQSKSVVDQVRYNSDPYFRAAADSALRAVEDPHCNPLDLPPDKYDQWRVITVTFDPKQML